MNPVEKKDSIVHSFIYGLFDPRDGAKLKGRYPNRIKSFADLKRFL